MGIRLIGTGACRLVVLLRVVNALLLTNIPSIWGINLLVRCVLRNQLLRIIQAATILLAGLVARSTAANGEDPEETACDAEDHGEPGDGEEVRIDVGFDSVCFGR